MDCTGEDGFVCISLPTKQKTRPIRGRTDSLACGRATAVATCHRHIAKSRLSNSTFSPSKHSCSLIGKGRTDSFAFPFPSGNGNRGFAPSSRREQQSTGLLHFIFRILCPPPPTKKPDLSVWFVWWGMVDSNHRRHSQQIYSLSPLATRELPHI